MRDEAALNGALDALTPGQRRAIGSFKIRSVVSEARTHLSTPSAWFLLMDGGSAPHEGRGRRHRLRGSGNASDRKAVPAGAEARAGESDGAAAGDGEAGDGEAGARGGSSATKGAKPAPGGGKGASLCAP